MVVAMFLRDLAMVSKSAFGIRGSAAFIYCSASSGEKPSSTKYINYKIIKYKLRLYYYQ